MKEGSRYVFRRSVPYVLAATLGSVMSSAAALATPPDDASEEVPRSGDAVVGETAPWFATWSPEGDVVNRTTLLAGIDRGGVLVFAASWCAPCLEGIDRLAEATASGVLDGIRVGVVIVEQDAEPLAHRVGAAASGWYLLHDRFFVAAESFGVAARGDGGGELALPLTVVFDRQGTVTSIIRAEGADYVDRIVSSLPVAGATPADSPSPSLPRPPR